MCSCGQRTMKTQTPEQVRQDLGAHPLSSVSAGQTQPKPEPAPTK